MQRDFGKSVGKFHDFVVAVAVICVVFGSMVHAAGDFVAARFVNGCG
jgi:hypothetical protein